MAHHIHRSVRAATKKVMERHGFAYAEILAQWPAIVGPDFAACCAPERVRWPKQNEASGRNSRRRTGGTLFVRVSDGRAVELQHETAAIIERINTYYGYQAITTLKVVQGIVEHKPARRSRAVKPRAEDAPAVAKEVRRIDDEALREALARLGLGAHARAAADRKARKPVRARRD